MRILFTTIILTALAALSTPTMADKGVDDAAAIKSTITAFLSAMSADDIKAAVSYVDHAASGSPLILLQADLNRNKPPREDVQSVRSEIHGEDATASVTIFSATDKDSAVSTVRLHRRAGRWLIVAPDTVPHLIPDNFIPFLAFSLAHPMVFIAAHQEARTTACTTQLKQVANSTLEYLLDNDAFPTDLSHFDKDLQPYLKRGISLACLQDPTIHYQINRKLAGMSKTQLAALPRLVMLYEGTRAHMLFPHEFRGLVAFADGTVQLVSQSEADKLAWDPAAGHARESRVLRSPFDLRVPSAVFYNRCRLPTPTCVSISARF